jgi:hypothetical protein
LKTFFNALGDFLTTLNWRLSVPANHTIIRTKMKHIGGKAGLLDSKLNMDENNAGALKTVAAN